jgi:hypothetical protein
MVEVGNEVAKQGSEDSAMTTTKLLTTLSLAAALALTAAPAHAQQRRGGHESGSRRGTAVQRGAVRGPAPAARGYQGRSYTVIRRDSVRSGPSFRSYRPGPRILSSRTFIIGGSRLYRPYYTFRPHLSLSFGLSLGYPVAYPYYSTPYVYGYPYPADPYAYGYPAPAYPPSPAPGYATAPPAYGSYSTDNYATVDPSSQQSEPGGLSFEIQPSNAAVFVDGTYVGTVSEFDPNSQPLGLMAGRHHIEIRAEGYRTMSFDADVTAGQVLPYRGALQRY